MNTNIAQDIGATNPVQTPPPQAAHPQVAAPTSSTPTTIPSDPSQTTAAAPRVAKADTGRLIFILLFVVLFPIGLYYIYFKTKWKLWVKILVSLPLIMVPVIAAIALMNY